MEAHCGGYASWYDAGSGVVVVDYGGCVGGGYAWEEAMAGEKSVWA